VKRRTLLLWLYPRPWRERYGDEFDALIEDLGASPAIWIDVFLAALRAHFDLGTRKRARLVAGPPGGIDPRGGAGMLVIRFTAAVLVGGIAVALILLPPSPVQQLISRTTFVQPSASQEWEIFFIADTPAFTINYLPTVTSLLLLVVAVTIGTLANRRAWLAAGCAYLVGATLWVAWLRPFATTWALRPSPPWAPSNDVWSTEGWLPFLLVNVLVGAFMFAVVAAAAHLIARAVRQRALRTN